jgi:hypothetical protein
MKRADIGRASVVVFAKVGASEETSKRVGQGWEWGVRDEE